MRSEQKTQVSSFHLSSFLPYTHYLVHTVALPGAPTRVSPASLGSLMTEMPSPEEAFVSLCCCSVGQSCPTLCDPMDCSPPGSWFLGPRGFSRQEYQSGLPCLPPGDLPNPGIESRSSALQEDFFFNSWATWKVGEPWVIPTKAERGRLENNQKTVEPGLPDEKDAKKGAASKVRCGHLWVISV